MELYNKLIIMDLSNYSEIQLLGFINKLKSEHENIKNNILQKVNNIETLESEINNLLIELNEKEDSWKIFITEYNNKATKI